MQFFGQFETEHGEEYLTESYLFFKNEDEDDLTPKEFKQLIKTQKLKKKNIAGTIIMYNPFYMPLGYDENKTLTSQGFDFDTDFSELKIEREIAQFRAAIKGYKGQLVQIRTLFNLNIRKVDNADMLVKLNSDSELLNSDQLTYFDKEMNYIDVRNVTINGKFVFFAWGHKTNPKEFLDIHTYAQSLYDRCVQMQKKVSFIFKKSTREGYAIEYLNFLHPNDAGKFTFRMPDSLKKVFETNPPQCAAFDDINAHRV